MTFAYPKLTSVSLPSVESWAQNNNILRDPPKSITTRRIDKVGQTSYITDLIDESGDRSCEGIRVYSRGVNPSQSVLYSGNQVGLAGGMISNINSSNAKLPYRIMDDGAFRPPILTARDLLPLSRLPRVGYEANANPSLVNYAKTKFAPSLQKTIKNLIHGFDVKPSKSFSMAKPIETNWTSTQAIQNPPQATDVHSGIKHSVEQFNQPRQEGIDMNRSVGPGPLQYQMDAPRAQSVGLGVQDSQGTIQDKRYIQDTLQYQLDAGYQPSEQHFGPMATPIQQKNLPQYNYMANSSTTMINHQVPHTNQLDLQRNLPQHNYLSNSSTTMINHQVPHNNQIALQRNLPQTSARAQITKIGRFDTSSTREITNLHGKGAIGASFQNSGTKPRMDRGDNDMAFSGRDDKIKMDKYVLKQQLNRF